MVRVSPRVNIPAMGLSGITWAVLCQSEKEKKKKKATWASCKCRVMIRCTCLRWAVFSYMAILVLLVSDVYQATYAT